MVTDNHENKRASSKDKPVAKQVLYKCIREKDKDKHYPSPKVACKTRKDLSFSSRSHVLLEKWCPWVWFHHSDSYWLGYQLPVCAGVRDQKERVAPMLEPACHAQVSGLGRGFVLEVKPASCTDEVELTFVIEEKALSLEATHAYDLAILRTETNVTCVRVHLPLKGFKNIYKSCISELALPKYFARQANTTAPFCRTLK